MWNGARGGDVRRERGSRGIETMGARGEKTLYDDSRVEGAELKNGGFESSEGWGVSCPNKNDYRAPMCNLEKPWGIITAAEAGVPAAEGEKMTCGSDKLNFTQRIRVRKGVPGNISFKARALPIKD